MPVSQSALRAGYEAATEQTEWPGRCRLSAAPGPQSPFSGRRGARRGMAAILYGLTLSFVDTGHWTLDPGQTLRPDRGAQGGQNGSEYSKAEGTEPQDSRP
jgi:hypothetical protein